MVEPNNPEKRELKLMPKSIQISQFKMYREDEERQHESMMIWSMAGLQLEALKKHFVAATIPLGGLPVSRVLRCFGIQLTDLMVTPNKNYVQIDANYKDLVFQDQYCHYLDENLLTLPERVIKPLLDLNNQAVLIKRIFGLSFRVDSLMDSKT